MERVLITMGDITYGGNTILAAVSADYPKGRWECQREVIGDIIIAGEKDSFIELRLTDLGTITARIPSKDIETTQVNLEYALAFLARKRALSSGIPLSFFNLDWEPELPLLDLESLDIQVSDYDGSVTLTDPETGQSFYFSAGETPAENLQQAYYMLLTNR